MVPLVIVRSPNLGTAKQVSSYLALNEKGLRGSWFACQKHVDSEVQIFLSTVSLFGANRNLLSVRDSSRCELSWLNLKQLHCIEKNEKTKLSHTRMIMELSVRKIVTLVCDHLIVFLRFTAELQPNLQESLTLPLRWLTLYFDLNRGQFYLLEFMIQE